MDKYTHREYVREIKEYNTHLKKMKEIEQWWHECFHNAQFQDYLSTAPSIPEINHM